MNYQEEIEQAKKVLKSAGYYVDNLWHIDDVMKSYEIDNESSYRIFDEVMNSESVIAYIFDQIDMLVTSEK